MIKNVMHFSTDPVEPVTQKENDITSENHKDRKYKCKHGENELDKKRLKEFQDSIDGMRAQIQEAKLALAPELLQFTGEPNLPLFP